jgi:hypothetical protein
MKYFKIIFLALNLITLVASNGFAREEGGMDAGGGMGTRSNKEFVERKIAALPFYAKREIEKLYESGLLSPYTMTDPELKDAVTRIFWFNQVPTGDLPITRTDWKWENTRKYSQIVDDESTERGKTQMNQMLSSLMISTQWSGPCPSTNHKDADGSVVSTTFPHICLSADKLARYPRYALDKELVGLVFHEVSHLKNLDEKIAKKVQYYLLQKLSVSEVYGFAKRNREILAEYMDSIWKMDVTDSELRAMKTRLCELENQLRGLTLAEPMHSTLRASAILDFDDRLFLGISQSELQNPENRLTSLPDLKYASACMLPERLADFTAAPKVILRQQLEKIYIKTSIIMREAFNFSEELPEISESDSEHDLSLTAQSGASL